MSGDLAHSPADIIRYALINASGGTLPTNNGSWPIYCNSEPDSPDNCITIYDTEGRQHGRSMIDGERQEHYGVQVRVRAADPPTGFTKAQDLALLLDKTIINANVSISSTNYIVYTVSRSGNVISLGYDTPLSKRRLFTMNATISLRQLN